MVALAMTTSRESTVVEQAKAIAFILESELSAAVTLFDVQSGDKLAIHGDEEPAVADFTLTADVVRGYAALKKPVITPATESTYLALLPIRESGMTKLLGLTNLTRFARGDRDTQQEIQRLEKWCGLLLEKLSTTSERGKTHSANRHREAQACSVLAAFDILLRNTRMHGGTARFQRHALKAVTEVLTVETAICVIGESLAMASPRSGNSLTLWECQQLAGMLSEHPNWDRAEILIDNNPANTEIGQKFPQIHGLAAVKIQSENESGYLIIINKVNRPSRPPSDSPSPSNPDQETKPAATPFQISDPALLASFSTLIAAQARTSNRYQDVKNLVVGLTRSLTAAIDAKDSYTAGHSERVARMAVELGKEMSLPEEQLNDIYLAGLLHDIGKIGIRDEVLCKDGVLTNEERQHINEHVVIGHRILSGLTGIDQLLDGVLYHHEQYNGTGYPTGLSGEQIPQLARIIAVADSFDAMSSDRPYREGMKLDKVQQIFEDGSGEQWDPNIVNAFLRCKQRMSEIRQRGIGESLREALDGAIRQDSEKDDASLNFAIKRPRRS
ncbi:MAG: HD-GYP domain-containing protein [Planctomycetota bacterium]